VTTPAANGDPVGELARIIVALERTVARLESTVGTLITWMAQSANSPIRVDEAERLLTMLHPSATESARGDS